MGFSFFPVGGPPIPSGGWIFGGGFGRYWGGQNWNRIFEKTRVGFGRTELSLMLSCTEFCALSSAHGPMGKGFFKGFRKTFKTLSPGTMPGPDDRAQNSVQDRLNESSVRPNPTLAFSKYFCNFVTFDPPPSTAPPKIQKSTPDGPP